MKVEICQKLYGQYNFLPLFECVDMNYNLTTIVLDRNFPIYGINTKKDAEKFIKAVTNYIRKTLPAHTEISRYTDDGLLIYMANNSKKSGVSIGRITFWSELTRLGTSLRFSETVFPVTVMQSPCKRPLSSNIFITCGMPPL